MCVYYQRNFLENCTEFPTKQLIKDVTIVFSNSNLIRCQTVTSFPSLVSEVNMSEKQSSKCMEMQEMEKPKGVQVEEGSESESDEDSEETEKEDDVTLPKINTFVGFIRLANFLSATTVLFILVTFLASGHVWQEQTKSAILTLIQVLFLGCLSILVYIDCIGKFLK